MSPAYLQSKDCIREMIRACVELKNTRILPIVIEKYNMKTACGSGGHHTGLLQASIGNILPPPDKGVFEDDFDGNMTKLIKRIEDVTAYEDSPAASMAHFESLVSRARRFCSDLETFDVRSCAAASLMIMPRLAYSLYLLDLFLVFLALR